MNLILGYIEVHLRDREYDVFNIGVLIDDVICFFSKHLNLWGPLNRQQINGCSCFSRYIIEWYEFSGGE